MDYSLLKLVTHIKVDPNKKNVLVLDKTPDGSFSHIDGAGKIIKSKLHDDFNVYTIWLSPKSVPDLPNQYIFNFTDSDYSDSYILLSTGDPNALEHNAKLFTSAFESIKELPEFEFMFIVANTYLTMPLQPYCSKTFSLELNTRMSEYFDYIGTDADVLDKIATLNHNQFSGKITDIIRRFSPFSLQTRLFTHVFYLIKFLYDHGKIKSVVSMITDPNLSRNFLQYHNIPHRLYYYADEIRGTREFYKAPVAQMQQLYLSKIKTLSLFDVKPKRNRNLIFAGTIFHEKGPRTAVWNELLKDFTDGQSDFYIPIKKNGIVRKKEKDSQVDKVAEVFPELYKSVTEHPLLKPFLPPEDLEKALPKYKYGLVLRCVSVFDSLNPKPYQYAYHGILPLFDEKYDESNLLIPAAIKDNLTVRSSADITRLIEFYNENETARLNMITRILDLYDHHNFITDPDSTVNKFYTEMLNYTQGT